MSKIQKARGRSDAVEPGSASRVPSESLRRISTGVPSLDLIVDGGLPANRVYLICGEPGTGKSTLALQFLLEGARHGEAGLFISLAETRDELLEVAASHAMDLSGVEILEIAAAEQERPEQDYTALHPAEVELGDSLDRIVEVVERINPTRVVVDSVTDLRLLSREHVRYRRQIIALKNFLMRRGCTAYFLDEAVPRGAGSADGQLQTICHGVIQLERSSPEYGRERRRLQVLKLRGVGFHGGYHDYVIAKGGVVIWPRLVAADHGREYAMQPVPSGVPELDALFGGGPDRGTAMLAVGSAGVGKSSLCHQYCLAALSRGEYFAWFSFDERVETFLRRPRAMGIDVRAAVDAGQCCVEQIDPGSLSPGEFMQRVRLQVEKRGARIVVIDSLNGYLNAMPGERFLVIQMHELLSYLSQMGVLTMIVVAQHGLLGREVETPVELSYLSDTVALLRYFEYAGEVRRAISVVKKRGASHEASIREFRVRPTGIEVGGPLRELQGVLAGVPRYTGDAADLMRSEDGNGRRNVDDGGD